MHEYEGVLCFKSVLIVCDCKSDQTLLSLFQNCKNVELVYYITREIKLDDGNNISNW